MMDMRLSKTESRWAYAIAIVMVFITMVLFAGGCSSTEKPIEVLKELVCPDTYLEQYKSSQRQIDRYESALIEANASLNVCMQKFDKNLSKSR